MYMYMSIITLIHPTAESVVSGNTSRYPKVATVRWCPLIGKWSGGGVIFSYKFLKKNFDVFC